MQTRVLTIFAHPDDAECVAGGTLLTWAAAGVAITLCIVTDGDKGNDDPDVTPSQVIAARREEQVAAASQLGAEVIYLGYEDGYLQPTIDLRRDLVRVIRRVRPHRVMSSDPTVWFRRDLYVNHPDHRAAGQAVLEALYPAVKKPWVFPELRDEGLEPHVVDEVWLGPTDEPNTWIDIGEVLEAKIDLICTHASQFPRRYAEPAFVGFARDSGKSRGLAAAEAFRVLKLSRRTVQAFAEAETER